MSRIKKPIDIETLGLTEEDVKEFGKAFLNNVDKELGITRTTIHLNFEQRTELTKSPAKCPNCKSTKLGMKNIPNPDHPLKQFRQRPTYYCSECGYWTDWFDGYTWNPPKNNSSEDTENSLKVGSKEVNPQ